MKSSTTATQRKKSWVKSDPAVTRDARNKADIQNAGGGVPQRNNGGISEGMKKSGTALKSNYLIETRRTYRMRSKGDEMGKWNTALTSEDFTTEGTYIMRQEASLVPSTEASAPLSAITGLSPHWVTTVQLFCASHTSVW